MTAHIVFNNDSPEEVILDNKALAEKHCRERQRQSDQSDTHFHSYWHVHSVAVVTR
jgi:hypothetical protein